MVSASILSFCIGVRSSFINKVISYCYWPEFLSDSCGSGCFVMVGSIGKGWFKVVLRLSHDEGRDLYPES